MTLNPYDTLEPGQPADAYFDEPYITSQQWYRQRTAFDVARNELLGELWQLGEAGVNVTRVVELALAHVEAATGWVAGALLELTERDCKVTSLESRLLDMAELEQLAADEGEARAELEQLVHSWVELARSARNVTGQSAAHRLTRAVRDEVPA